MSPTSNSSAAYEYRFFYPELDISCDLENIPAFSSTFLPVLYSLLFVAGLVGNVLVIWILTVFKKVRAMTDVQWTFGNAMCKIISSAYFIGFYSSTFFITIMSFDRYLAIVRSVYALQVRTTAYGVITSLVLWAIAILASTPDLIFFQETNNNNWTKCTPHYPDSNNGWKTFSNFEVNVLGWLIPVSVLIFCYHSILKNLQKCHTQNKYKAMKLVFVVVIVFFLFWTPVNIVIFLDSLRNMYIIDDCQTSQKLDLAMEVAEVLSFIHCCLNPIIYAFVGEKFKKHLR
ncbi:C-C chemokine receptor type 8, partial [Phalacrocorax carbo]